MNEHEMCCGTTCDKKQVAAEFEKLKRERDEALAYGERLCSAWDAVKNADWDEPMDEAVNMQPPAALAALKAEWQAEALRCISDLIKSEFPLFADDGLDPHEHHCEWALQQDRKRIHKIIQCAQEAK